MRDAIVGRACLPTSPGQLGDAGQDIDVFLMIHQRCPQAIPRPGELHNAATTGGMSRIFNNIEQDLPGGLRATLAVTKRADFCVGYLNLRGWQGVVDLVHPWSVADGQICRVLAGMQRPPLTLQGLAPQVRHHLRLSDPVDGP